jgi:hypothetical protein
MAYTLIGKTDYIAVTVTAWERLLKLGKCFGWKPAGTKPPAGIDNWGGNYIGKDGQPVTDEDATALAAALAKALDDIPEEDAMGGKMASNDRIKNIAHGNLLDCFSGTERKQTIREFIAFCRMGRFTIN